MESCDQCEKTRQDFDARISELEEWRKEVVFQVSSMVDKVKGNPMINTMLRNFGVDL